MPPPGLTQDASAPAMLGGAFSRRLLTLLQLTRMALVFTAVSNALCALMLRHSVAGDVPDGWAAGVAAGVMAAGLYAFGMTLNDLIDRRRDAHLSPDRPIPAGRIGLRSAHALAIALAAVAGGAGLTLASLLPDGRATIVVLIGTFALIGFYDVAGKYLVAPGLVTLGLIRFFHAAIAAPGLPVPWHALLLLNHVTLLSAVAYRWERKRPAMTGRHWAGVVGALTLFNGLLIALLVWRRGAGLPPDAWADHLSAVLQVRPALVLPGLLAVGFVAVVVAMKPANAAGPVDTPAEPTSGSPAPGPLADNSRAAGRRVMLLGLLWLILYDAAFTLAYVGPIPSLVLAMLLPAAYGSVKIMRAWALVAELGQPPRYRRAR